MIAIVRNVDTDLRRRLDDRLAFGRSDFLAVDGELDRIHKS